MKLSKMLISTLREVPGEAEIASHQLMLRAGMIRKSATGIYTFMPNGVRVLKNVENIVREEMDRAGAQEFLASALIPANLWQESGRWDVMGSEMIRLKDRNGRDFCLGPTHEEVFTDLARNEIKSYKQLPLNLYQIQTKYRDERRPRFGVMRSREFIMKDAYSFDRDVEGMEKSYQDMWKAYERIFTRLKLKYKVVEGDSGAMGGNQSHEFMAMSEVGESLVAYCDNCDYAATDEKATVVYNVERTEEDMKDMEKVPTPNTTTIEDLVDFFHIDKSNFGKALVYKIGGEPVVAIIPGDRELNETKLCNYLKVPEHELELADEKTIEKISGAAKGFTGPVGLKEDVKILVDSRITHMRNIIVGGNETDYHLKNVNFGRDFTGEVVEDLLLIDKGDICPKCGKTLLLDRGIEVGNIFQLGTKYSDSLKATYLDENGKEQPIVMGSYGVGVSRSMAAIVEQYHDENGIIWPLVVAPYHVIITIINVKNEEQRELGERIYKELKDRGLEVLLDDRNERAGVKFNDRDLIGIPIRITVGKRANENIVEYSLREDGINEDIPVEAIGDKIEEKFKKEGLTI